MGKTGSKAVGEVQTKIVFATISKEIGEGDDKKSFLLSYENGTERFSLKKNGSLLISSSSLRDCVLAGEEHGLKLTDEEKKVTLKPVKTK